MYEVISALFSSASATFLKKNFIRILQDSAHLTSRWMKSWHLTFPLSSISLVSDFFFQLLIKKSKFTNSGEDFWSQYAPRGESLISGFGFWTKTETRKNNFLNNYVLQLTHLFYAISKLHTFLSLWLSTFQNYTYQFIWKSHWVIL